MLTWLAMSVAGAIALGMDDPRRGMAASDAGDLHARDARSSLRRGPGGARAQLRVLKVNRDETGTWHYHVLSDHLGSEPTTVRIVPPARPAAGKRHRFLFILPVATGVSNVMSRYGDGLEEARQLGVHDRHDLTLVAPSFPMLPWYADHASDPARRLESFLVRDLVPWLDQSAGCATPARLLVGFSKSGWGALTLILRHPDVFSAAAVWDAPAQLHDLSRFADLRENFGTEANFREYEVSRLVFDRAAPFRARNRLWISGDRSAWTTHMEALRDQMTAAGVRHTYVGGVGREHHWNSGWLPHALDFLAAVESSSEAPLARPADARRRLIFGRWRAAGVR